MTTNGHRHTGSVSQTQNYKAQLATAYNELGKELSSTKIRVVGNYTLGRVIGEGTYGKVRLGVHRLTGTRVAVKQIPKAMSASLTREIHHHRQLHHPHVTQLHEVIATESSIWLVTELCSGGELFDYLAEKGRLEEEEARILFGQLCLAVAYLHEKGIVHRDLKLENVLLDERCRVKLGDFGFTREFERGCLLETFCGTTGYAAPEMLLSKKYSGPEVDIWSLGVILYTLLTGTLPFDDDDDSIMREKVIDGQYEDPEWLSEDCRSLIKNIIVTDPTKRLTIAEILAHPWFTAAPAPARPQSPASSLLPSRSESPSLLRPPSPAADAQPLSASSVTSDSSFHSASSEMGSSTPTTPDEGVPGDVFLATSPDDHTINRNASQATLRNKAAPRDDRDFLEKIKSKSTIVSEQTSIRPSVSRATTSSNNSSKAPPGYPTRTPARTKRRSVSSTLSDPASPTFEKPLPAMPPQDFSSLLSTPAPIIFSTPLEQDLLNSLSALGFDTGQIVHSVLTDACDATGALWWILKRKAELKSLVEGNLKPTMDASEKEEEPKAIASLKGEEKSSKSRSLGVGPRTRSPIPPALTQAHSTPELQLIPATPTVPSSERPQTPPRPVTILNPLLSPVNPLLSPVSPAVVVEATVRSHPTTPVGSVKDKEAKGRKARAGSVSIMQRATTALEAAGLVRKKSSEIVREEKEREKSVDKRMGSGDEPRSSHGSGGSGKLIKSPVLKASKPSNPSTPPASLDVNPAPAQMGSPWVITGGKVSPPATPLNSPGDTLTSLPNIGEHGSKLPNANRNRASLLSAFRMWFREDPKGKRKESPTLGAQSITYNHAAHGPGMSPVSGRGRGSVKVKRRGSTRGIIHVGRKSNHRAKRASVSSRRSSSVNSKRSSITSAQIGILDSSSFPEQMAPMTRQRSDPSRRSFGSHTPNSDRDEHISRPSSIHSFSMALRHRKSPSVSSTGSMYPGRTASPLPKYHRRGGSGSSTRVVRQMQPSASGKHLRSNSASSNHSRASSRQGSLYDYSETEGRRTGSPLKQRSRGSLDDPAHRATHSTSTFIAQKRQTPFSNPSGGGYLNSFGRSSWKKSWGLEPPGWQTRSAHPTIEVLAISPATDGSGEIRDVFTGRHSLNMGDESDWVDEDDDCPGYAGGLGQMPTSASSSHLRSQSLDSPLLSSLASARGAMPRATPPPKRSGGPSAPPIASTSSARGSRNKSAGRNSPSPIEPTFEAPETRGGRRQLPAGRSRRAFRGHAIQEEDEDEEE